MRLHAKLFIIWGLVVLLLFAGTWWPVRHAVESSFTQLAADEFSATRRDLHTQEAERVRAMRQAAAMLMNIPELRALIAEHNFEVSSDNLASLQERLDNLAEIVGVSFVCVLDARGNVIAQNHASPWKTLPELNAYLSASAPGKAMVARVFSGGTGSSKAASANAFGMWSFRGRLFEAVGVPLVFNSDAGGTPQADGGLVMAAPLTDELADSLAVSHKCQVSFLSGGVVAAASLPPIERAELNAAAQTWGTPAERIFDLTLNGVSYRSSIDVITDPCSNSAVGAMLIQSDLKDAQAARASVSRRLIVSMIGGILAAAMASFLVSGAVTRPVRELCRGVKRLADCDLEVKINVSGQDELGELARAFNDMVRQLRVRRELERVVEEARATSKAKSEFLATMSHEIRTPLNGVIGMAELLLRSGLGERQRRYAGMVKSSAEVLTTLINDILDFSKIEAGKLELETLDFDLAELTEDVVELLSIKAMGKGLEVACDIDSNVAGCVRGDPTRLRQIVVNLLNNAIKFTDQGQVIVRVSRIAQGDLRQIRFEVIDSGIGIPADRIGRLFQSFSQVDASTTRRFGGTGLGLAISKQLVELMGGTIGVNSEAGRGSTFWFNVPLAMPADSSIHVGSAPRTDLATPITTVCSADPTTLTQECEPLYRNDAQLAALAEVRVMVVQENVACREVLCRMLAGLGCQTGGVSTAEAATFALALARTQGLPYRIAIIDKTLAGAQAIERPADLPVLWLVPMGSETDAEQQSGAGASACLAKPVRRKQLIASLLAAIGKADLAARESPGENQLGPSPNGRRHRVLLAEDNAVNQVIASELLEAAGYTCDIVGDGHAAVEAVERGGYDLVLMDCQMPTMDGFEATRAIRARERQIAAEGPTPHRIPIIALTANTGSEDKDKCIDAGMDAYCSKPFSVDQLLGAISALLSWDDDRPKENTPVADPQTPAFILPPPAGVITELPVIPFEINTLLRHCSGNAALALTVMGKFERQSAEALSILEQSVKERDFSSIVRTSHHLKGTADVLAAGALQRAASRLEALGSTGDAACLAEGLSQIQAEVTNCLAYIATARIRIGTIPAVSTNPPKRV